MAEKKRERQAFIPKWQSRLTKLAEASAKIGRAMNAAGFGNQAKTFGVLSASATACATELSKLPKDFSPSGQTRFEWTKGQTANVIDDANVRALYGGKPSDVYIVQDVVRIGGSEEGRGSKLFLRCKRPNGDIMVYPATHLKPVAAP